MRVAITGGTGFVGPSVVAELLRAGHDVVVLEHAKPLDVPDHPHLTRVKGDITDPASLAKAFDRAEAVAHLVAIIREVPKKGITFERIHVEGTRNVVAAAKRAGVRRFLLMSANGVDLGIDTRYFVTKREMERLVKDAGFGWTIFRPGYIAGPDDGGFDAQFARIVDRAPILPSFGGGKFEIQPVARENVAQAFARALERNDSIGKTYVLVGPERMTWNEYLRRLARLRGRKRAIMTAPRGMVLAAAGALGSLFPADKEQIKMLMAGNTGDPSGAVKDLDLRLLRWEDAVSGLRR